MSKFLSSLFRKNVGPVLSRMRSRPTSPTRLAMSGVTAYAMPQLADAYSGMMGTGELSTATKMLLGTLSGAAVLKGKPMRANQLFATSLSGIPYGRLNSQMKEQFGGNLMDPTVRNNLQAKMRQDFLDSPETKQAVNDYIYSITSRLPGGSLPGVTPVGQTGNQVRAANPNIGALTEQLNKMVGRL